MSRRKYLTPAEALAHGWMCCTTMAKEYRLKPAPGQAPAGHVWQGHGVYEVYDPADAIPMRPYRQPSPAQLAALALGRSMLGTQACSTTGCPERVDPRSDTAPLCPCCDQRKRRLTCQREIQSWVDQDGVVLDVETTGLSEDAEVIEVCVIDRTGAVLLNTLVKPAGAVPADASAIHGLMDAHLQDAPTWPQIHDDLCRALDGRPMLAYNAEFDLRMLEQTVGRHALPLPKIKTLCAMHCTARWNGELTAYGDYRWCRLSEAAALLGITPAGEHRARDDCQTTLALVLAMLAAG